MFPIRKRADIGFRVKYLMKKSPFLKRGDTDFLNWNGVAKLVGLNIDFG